MTEKAALRTEIRKEIHFFKGGDLSLIPSLLNSLADFTGESVALYMADQHEIDLLKLFPDSKLYLPRYSELSGLYDFSLWSGDEQDLRMGPYKIPEPGELVEPEEINFVFIPGLAFAKTGERLGRGGGFYDRLLAKYTIGTRVGVCHDFQLKKHIPTEPHDFLMDFILTPSVLIKSDRTKNN